jgi:putative intracellular protease/amidase
VPDRDFDVTEVAVPWRLLTRAGHVVRFATEHGSTAPNADQRLLDGVIFGQLGAAAEPKAFYAQMQSDDEFRAPVSWADVKPDEFDGLILPGGHAPGMRQYLGSEQLRGKVAEFWALGRPVGAICHGVLVLARTRDLATGRSLLYGRRTTCLPKYMERSAFFTTAWRLGRYYRTYPAYVEAEVRGALRGEADFVRGPRVLSKRGTETDDGAAFVVRDGNYVSARWPGDAYLFAKRFADRLGAPRERRGPTVT